MSSDRVAPPSALAREEVLALGGLVALSLITTAWWALALWPVESSPAWLERTRYVCFGVSASGLPDAGGWVGLIGGPVGMLLMLLFGWGTGVKQLLRRARRSRLVFGIFVLLGLSGMMMVTGAALRVRAVAAASAKSVDTNKGEELPPASYPRLNQPSPALSLISQSGTSLSLSSLRGSPVLVTFAYAHCTTVCPVIVQQVLRAQAALDSAGTRVPVLIVTLDPWRDTPSRLPSLAESWTLPATDAYVLSGSVDDVTRVLDEWQVPYERNATSGEVTHPALVYVIDAAGRIAFASNGGAAALVSLVQRL